MKKFEEKIGIEKRFIHVRINTSGSPLERSPGVFVCVWLSCFRVCSASLSWFWFWHRDFPEYWPG